MKKTILTVLLLWAFAAAISTAAENHGYLRVDKNKRYFVFDDGTPYIPIGFNRFLFYRESFSNIDSFMEKWADHGVNYLRLWVGVACDPETEVGVFDSEQMEKLDYIVKKCEETGISLVICFWNDNCIRPDLSWGWDSRRQIYNKKYHSTGTTYDVEDMKGTTHAPTWNAMKNRFATFVNRWEDSRAVIMWDLVNDTKKNEDWKLQMYDYVREIDSQNRIITLQYNTGVDPKGETDCGSVRVYNYNPEGNDPEEMMISLDERIRQALAHGDPVYCGEGRMDYSSGPRYAIERGFLHFLWAPVACGSAGNLHSWIDGSNKWFDLTDLELDWLKGLSDFCTTIDWSNFNSRNVNDEVTAANQQVKAFACRDDDEMLIYLMNDDPEHEFNAIKTTVNISSKLSGQQYNVSWIDIRTGKIIKKVNITRFPAEVEVPEFSDGIFAHIQR